MFPFPLYFSLLKKASLSFVSLNRYNCFHSCGKSSVKAKKQAGISPLAFCHLDTFNLILFILTNDVHIPENPLSALFAEQIALVEEPAVEEVWAFLFFFQPLTFSNNPDLPWTQWEVQFHTAQHSADEFQLLKRITLSCIQ